MVLDILHRNLFYTIIFHIFVKRVKINPTIALFYFIVCSGYIYNNNFCLLIVKRLFCYLSC